MACQNRQLFPWLLLLLFIALVPVSHWSSASPIPSRHQYSMDWNDTRDFDFASRGFIADRDDPLIRDENGRVVYDKSEGAFLEENDPGPINPSLLRQARLLRKAGLFEVVDGVYQVRGFDITNITFVRGETGWVVIDPLMTPTTARAAYELVSEHLGQRPIKAVIYTHSHVDHFGGAAGIISQEKVDSGEVAVIAPEGFLESTLSEFVVNGAAMHRRTEYAGVGIPRGPEGTITSGLADGPARGPLSLIPPTVEISHTGEQVVIDGVELEFQLTPNTEALAEMNIYLPQFRVLDMAENANVTMHNIQPYETAEESRRYVEAMGGSDRVIELAREFSSRGDDRWATELLNRIVMADSGNQAARNQLADAYTRLAFQQENGIWRAQYLSAARELRLGIGDHRFQSLVRSPILEKMPTITLFELLSVRLDPKKVGGGDAEIDFIIPERSEHIRVSVRNQVLIHEVRPEGAVRDASVTLSRSILVAMIVSQEVDPAATINGSRE